MNDHGSNVEAPRPAGAQSFAASPLGGLTLADVPLIEAEKLSEQTGPSQGFANEVRDSFGISCFMRGSLFARRGAGSRGMHGIWRRKNGFHLASMPGRRKV